MKQLAGIASKFSTLSPRTQGIIVKIGALVAALILVMPWMEKFGKSVSSIYKASRTAITGLVNLIKGMRGTATAAEGEALPAMSRLGGAIRKAGSAALNFVKNLATQTAALVKTAAKWIWNTGAMIANKVATMAISAATKAAAAAQWLLNAAMSANPIGLVVIAIVALVAIVVIAWKKNEKFREILTKAWNAIKHAAIAVFNWIKKAIPAAFHAIVEFAKKWSLPGIIFSHWKQIKEGAIKVWNSVINFIKGIPGKILRVLSGFGSLLKNIGGNLIKGLHSGISKAWTWLTDKLKGLVNLLPGVVKKVLGIRSPSRVFMTLGQQIGQGLQVGILATQKNVQAAAERVSNAAIKAVTKYQEQVAALRSRTGDLMGSWGVGELVTTDKITSESLLAGIKSQATAMSSFLSNIKKLKGTKLSAAVISGLLAAGPQASGGQAAAFATMTPKQIAQYNASYSAERNSAGKLATLELGKATPPAPITIASGAVKVNINVAGNASEHDIRVAVNSAFKTLTKELRNK